MKKILGQVKTFAIKHGAVLVGCAFAFVTLSANSSCTLPFHEPKAPNSLDAFKKFN